MAQEDNTVLIEDARIIFRNFAGKEGPYNSEGIRGFSILLDPEMADRLSAEGWNVKTTREREGDDGEVLGGEPHIPVRVSYKGRPPRVVLITSRGRTDLGEEEIEILDYSDIRMVDLIIRPYDWAVNGKTGRKAYLKSIFVTINEDELELKYSGVNIAGSRPASVDEEE